MRLHAIASCLAVVVLVAPPLRADDPIAASERHEKHRTIRERTGVYGVRVSALRVRGGDSRPEDHTLGVLFAGSSEKYATWSGLSAKSASSWAIGGGSGGLEGAFGGALAVGWRLPAGPEHGPVARVGVGGELLGNSKLYFSRLELPEGQLGYQYLRGRTLLELGVRGGPVLAGRYNTGDAAVRKLGGSFEWGGYGAAHNRFGRFDFSMLRVEARSAPGTPVDLVRGALCAFLGDAVALCGDVSFFRGDVTFGLPEQGRASRSVYGGATLGFLGW